MDQEPVMLDQILNKLLAEPRTAPAYPAGYYSADGDCVFIYNEGGAHVRDRVDGLLTVFRSPENGRIIGLQVKGVRGLDDVRRVEVKTLGTAPEGMRIDVVTLLLRSYKAESGASADESAREPERTRAYRDALGLFGCQTLDVELQGA
jgi:hypothetical protein